MNIGEKKGMILRLAGVVLIILGVLADTIGLGGSIGFGYKQIALVILGGVLLFLGGKPCGCQKK